MRFISIIASALVLFSWSMAEQQAPAATLLPWSDDIEQAFAAAKAQSLPIYLYFTGSTWCIWCKRMDKDLHNTDDFRQLLVGKIVFVKADLPAGTRPDERIQKLMSTYHVRGVPTVIILSPDLKEITRFQYQQIQPKEYAQLVLQAISPPSQEKPQ